MKAKLRNFRRIQTGIDVSSFMQEIALNEKEWSDVRAKAIPLHKDTVSIILRSHVEMPGVAIINTRKVESKFRYTKFPHVTSWLESFVLSMGGVLRRAQIVKMRPSGHVAKHADIGEYYQWSDRYHLVLQSEGSEMICGEERVVWHTGELWWFNNKEEHEATHDGAHERIHLIFDVESLGSYWRVCKRMLRGKIQFSTQGERI